MNELCIRCNKPTPYQCNTPITLRRYYIEGSGQLCEDCYYTLYPRFPLQQPHSTVTDVDTRRASSDPDTSSEPTSD